MARDPFMTFGLQGAQMLLADARRSTDPERVVREALESFGPGLWATMLTKQATYRAKGYPTAEAQRLAIAATLANRYSTLVVERGRELGYEDLGGFLGSAWNVVKSAAGALNPKHAVSAAGKALKDLACKASGSPLFGIAAGGAAMAAGAPPQVGITGAQVVAGACAPAAPAYVPPPPPPNPYIVPAMIGGGVLLLVLVLKD
jgi:hypothetical protein